MYEWTIKKTTCLVNSALFLYHQTFIIRYDSLKFDILPFSREHALHNFHVKEDGNERLTLFMTSCCCFIMRKKKPESLSDCKNKSQFVTH